MLRHVPPPGTSAPLLAKTTFKLCVTVVAGVKHSSEGGHGDGAGADGDFHAQPPAEIVAQGALHIACNQGIRYLLLLTITETVALPVWPVVSYTTNLRVCEPSVSWLLSQRLCAPPK